MAIPHSSASVPVSYSADDDRPWPHPPEDVALRPRRGGPTWRSALGTAVALSAAVGVGQVTGSWWVGVSGLLGAAVIGFSYAVMQLKRFHEENNRANEQLLAGHPEDAAAAFEMLARRWRKAPSSHVLALFNYAVALSRAGKLREALAVLGGLAVEDKTESVVSIKLWKFDLEGEIAAQLARNFALLGDGDAAAAWMRTAKKKSADDARGVLAVTGALVSMRQERAAEAIEQFEAGWDLAKANLPPDGFRGVTLVRAFAAAQLSADDADRWAMTLRPVEPGEFGYLTGHWPELAAYVDALCAKDASSGSGEGRDAQFVSVDEQELQ